MLPEARPARGPTDEHRNLRASDRAEAFDDVWLRGGDWEEAMKAADISDDAIYLNIIEQYRERKCGLANVWDVFRAFPQFPEKVVMAKIRQMIAKGRLIGCGCGCRGDLLFPWMKFGDKVDVDNWRVRVESYLKNRGKR